MNSLLLKNCRILLPDHTVTDGNLLVENGIIAAVGETSDGIRASETRDLRGALVMPGLVNAHGHTAMTLVRGLGGGLPLKRWLEEAIFPVEARMTPADIEAGVTWGVMEMLAGGTTCVAVRLSAVLLVLPMPFSQMVFMVLIPMILVLLL